MEYNKVLLGNSLEVIKTFPDESVDCVVTSPPYYGLRDYGTGTWIGGDPNCPHFRTSHFSEKIQTGHRNLLEMHGVADSIYKSVCPLCGAVRKDEQIGLEETPEEYIARLVSLFREIRRVLKKDGTCWVNLGDSYNSTPCGNTPENMEKHKDSKSFKKPKKGGEMSQQRKAGLVQGLKPKDLIGVPWLFAFAMRADGWFLRQDIIWAKTNPMPESIKDRCTKSHEYIFLFSKSEKYYFDYQAIQEKATSEDDLKRRLKSGNEEWKTKKAATTYAVSGTGRSRTELYSQNENGEYMRNKRDVWSVPVMPTKEAHFATYPQKLICPCIQAGCRVGGGGS